MRLDKFLKVSRIIKRRTVANDACDTEHVSVNGKRAKASYDVKVDDVIEITFGERTLRLKVLDVREHVAKADASALYTILD
ncbi:MAG: RNA-binding S4 domain-containing protein [Clostridia bacterium]|nr:RNA-binding S4 domain-containing protein [Oscillospiraceae bacterium]MBQ8276773.1 RNA-binding S4 domain-containing protein [Clostridia bacterium]